MRDLGEVCLPMSTKWKKRQIVGQMLVFTRKQLSYFASCSFQLQVLECGNVNRQIMTRIAAGRNSRSTHVFRSQETGSSAFFYVAVIELLLDIQLKTKVSPVSKVLSYRNEKKKAGLSWENSRLEIIYLRTQLNYSIWTRWDKQRQTTVISDNDTFLLVNLSSILKFNCSFCWSLDVVFEYNPRCMQDDSILWQESQSDGCTMQLCFLYDYDNWHSGILLTYHLPWEKLLLGLRRSLFICCLCMREKFEIIWRLWCRCKQFVRKLQQW